MYDTVCTAGSVKGRRSSILHDREALDVVRLEPGEVGGGQLDVVDEDERTGVGTESRDTTDKEVGVVLARLTRTLVCDDTRNVSRKRGREVAGRNFQRLHVYGGHGADHAFLLLLSERDHDSIFQLVLVIGKLDDEVGHVSDLDDLGDLSHSLELEVVGRLHSSERE